MVLVTIYLCDKKNLWKIFRILLLTGPIKRPRTKSIGSSNIKNQVKRRIYFEQAELNTYKTHWINRGHLCDCGSGILHNGQRQYEQFHIPDAGGYHAGNGAAGCG